MINQQTFESLILTNTIVAAFCIVLLVTFTVFIILFLLPLLRRRCLNEKEKTPSVDLSSTTNQPYLTLNSSRFNPLFEPTAGTSAMTTTQFGTLFHPHATTATLLHPTIWTSVNPTSSAFPQLSSTTKPPPLPAQPPVTTTPKSPKKL